MQREEARQRIKELKDEIDSLEEFAKPFMITDALGGKTLVIEMIPGGIEIAIYHISQGDTVGWSSFVLNQEQLRELIAELQSYESN